MMSENHKRRQLGDTKKKEQRWLDGNGKGKKKKNWIVIRDQSYLFTTHWTRQCALTMNRGRQSQWLCFLKLFEITTGCCNNIFEGMKSRIKLNDALWRVWILFWPFFFSFVFCFVFREGREEKKIVKWGRLSFVWLFLRKWNQDVLVDIIWRGGLLSSKTPSLPPPPPYTVFFSSVSLAVTGCCLYKWLLCAGEVDRRLWLSFPHYFVGQNESCLIFSFVSQFHFDAQTFEVCVVMSSSNRGPPSTTTQVFFSHFCCWFVCFSFSLRTLCVS